MIAKLKGIVDAVGDDFAIIDVNGVGYLVHASGRSLSSLPRAGEAVGMHIETVVREDAITLFGFTSLEERDMFRMLTSVQGVGAKVGLALLSIAEPVELQHAIAAQDKATVARANGVGPKLAGRIVNELKDKVTNLVFGSAPVSASGSVSGAAAPAVGTEIQDAISALANLGYRPTDAHAAVAKAAANLGEGATVGTLVPAALKELATL